MGLKHSLTSKVQWKFGNDFYTIGTVMMPNSRKTVEDTILVQPLGQGQLGTRVVAGVFDGHGGDYAAKFLEKNLPEELNRIKVISGNVNIV
jgi:serine/threonine protein phosphatase PrpC